MKVGSWEVDSEVGNKNQQVWKLEIKYTKNHQSMIQINEYLETICQSGFAPFRALP